MNLNFKTMFTQLLNFTLTNWHWMLATGVSVYELFARAIPTGTDVSATTKIKAIVGATGAAALNILDAVVENKVLPSKAQENAEVVNAIVKDVVEVGK